MAFYPLERLMNLYDGYQKAFHINGMSLLLIQDEGRRYLIINQCPHQQAPLAGSTVQNGKIRCQLHGMSFDLLSGVTTDGCQERLKALPLIFEGSSIGVDL